MSIFNRIFEKTASKMLKSSNVSEKDTLDFKNNPEHFLAKPENDMKFNHAINLLLQKSDAVVNELPNGGVKFTGDFSKLPYGVGMLVNMIGYGGRKDIVFSPEMQQNDIYAIKLLPESVKNWMINNPKKANFVYKKFLKQLKKHAR